METKVALQRLGILVTGASMGENLEQFAPAVVVGATVREGYSGLAWEAGTELLAGGKLYDRDPVQFFEAFGWEALANGICASLREKHILEGLSYVKVPFLPPTNDVHILDHPQVVKAILDGLAETPRPFVRPAELGAADEEVQYEFGELLQRLVALGADEELCLQWSSCALRVLPTQSLPYRAAAVSLLRTLLRSERNIAAYYVYRALAEQIEELWDDPVSLEVLRTLISQYWQDSPNGHEVLVQLCADDEVLRHCRQHSDTLVMLGALAIHLSRHYDYDQVAPAAWRFVNDLLEDSAWLSSVFGDYLESGTLPELPTTFAGELALRREELDSAVRSAERAMRRRQYKQIALAGRIYNENLQHVFYPILEAVQSSQFSEGVLDQIRGLDPESLVVDSGLQRLAPYPIEGRVLRKMIRDHVQIIEALESAAQARAELEKAKSLCASQSSEEFGLYDDFALVSDSFGQVSTWALQTFVPDLWERLQDGTRIVAIQREVLSNAEGLR